jgi:nicotinamide mononucleotide transporter
MKALFTVWLILFYGSSSLATTYYISPKGSDSGGNGSLTNPWRSLSKATATVTTAGDIIHVNAGLYSETTSAVLAVGVSIEGEGTISVIQSVLQQEFIAIIIAASPEGTDGNQHISNLKLDGNKRTTSLAIEIRGRKNVSIHDCIITDFEHQGILWAGRNDNKDEPPGIYATGNSLYNNIITNCAKYDGYGRGCINIGGQDGMLIYKNTITQTGRSHGTNGWPIKYTNDGYLKAVKIYNNIITKEPYDGTSWDFAFELFNVSGLEIYNNTVVGSIDLNHQIKGDYPYSVFIHDNIIGPDTMHSKLENGIILEYETEAAIVEHNQMKNLGVIVYFTPREHDMISDVTIKNNTCNNIGVADGSHQGFAVRLGEEVNRSYALENLFIVGNKFIASTAEKPYWGIAILGSLRSSNIQVRNNTIENFSAGAITANPAFAVDSMIIEGNILSNNGNGNKPAFTGGNPAHYTYRNNSLANSPALSFVDLKMNVIRPLYYEVKNTSILEFIALFAAFLSFWFYSKENIYAFPMTLISAVIYLFSNFDEAMLGEGCVTLYFIVMSIHGWLMWLKRDRRKHRIIRITTSTKKEITIQLSFFLVCFTVIFSAVSFFSNYFAPNTVRWADSLAIAAGFTCMWLITKKKTESWYWCIAATIMAIPLNFIKHHVLISVYYGLLLMMAFWCLYKWKRKKVRRKKVQLDNVVLVTNPVK